MAGELAAGAALLGGATPFGWAQLGMSVLGGAAKGTPAGPSNADGMFGPSMLNADSSGWMVNIGSASNALDNGNRGAPNQTPMNQYAPGGYLAPVVAPGNTAAAVAGSLANLPWIYIIGGAALLIVLWKKT